MMLHQEFRRAYIVFFGTDFLPTIMSNFRLLLLLSHGCCFSWSFPFWSETNVPYDLWELIRIYPIMHQLLVYFCISGMVWCVYILSQQISKERKTLGRNPMGV